MTYSISSARTQSAPFSIPVIPQSPKSLERQLEEAREYARFVSDKYGVMSAEAATAWDIVEEILAARSDLRQQEPNRAAFEDYCREFPEAFEARMYDV
ncbi:MAG: Calvin cycle protein CP12 [Synechococcales bacterium]|nr:Calvin cycle protein CP12 [Synechococcales bacterium]